MNGAVVLPLLLTIPGALFVRRFRPGAASAETAGLGGLVGLGSGLLLVWLAGAMGLPMASPVVFAALATAAALLLAVSARRGKAVPSTRAPSPSWTPAEIALLALVVAVFLVGAWRAAFYPVSAMDAHSYDGRARWIVAERTLDVSVYRTLGVSGSSNLAYPPLMPLGLSLAYWTGAAEGKRIDAFYFAALLCVVYGLLRRRLPRIGALAAAALTAMIPELWRHASLCLTNLPATAFLTAALLTAADTLAQAFESGKAGRRTDWILPGLLAAFAAGVRPDAVVPAAGAAAVTVLVLFVRTRRIRAALEPGLLFLAPAAILTAAWQAELHGMIGGGGAAVFRKSLAPDPVLLGNTLRAFAVLLPNPSLAGWALPVFTIGFAGWIVDRGTPSERAAYAIHAAFTIGTLVLLFALFQQIDPSFGGGGGSYLQNSLKRALFYALPVAIASGFLSPPIRNNWDRLDRFQRSDGKDS